MSDIRRNLHDGSVDMFNSRGDWQVQLAKGAEMLKKLADSKIAWLSNQDQTDKNQLDKCLLEWMAISDQLGDILDRMTSVVNKFRRVSDRFQSLQDLSCLNSSFNSSVNQSRSSQVSSAE